jgi:hypothetical protein
VVPKRTPRAYSAQPPVCTCCSGVAPAQARLPDRPAWAGRNARGRVTGLAKLQQLCGRVCRLPLSYPQAAALRLVHERALEWEGEGEAVAECMVVSDTCCLAATATLCQAICLTLLRLRARLPK